MPHYEVTVKASESRQRVIVRSNTPDEARIVASKYCACTVDKVIAILGVDV